MTAAPTAGPPLPGGNLKAKAKANPQLVVGAVAVAVVILLALKSKSAAGTAAGSTTATGQAAGTTTGYDSTANDVYQSLMGQMQTLQNGLTGATASTPTPTPLNQLYTSFTRNAADGAVYGVSPLGVQTHLSPADYAALGNPAYTSYGSAPTPPAPAVQATAAHTPTPYPTGGPGLILRWGSVSNASQQINTRLSIGADKGGTTFTKTTQAAVMDWQKKHGFTPNGIVDRNVWAAMFK